MRAPAQERSRRADGGPRTGGAPGPGLSSSPRDLVDQATHRYRAGFEQPPGVSRSSEALLAVEQQLHDLDRVEPQPAVAERDVVGQLVAVEAAGPPARDHFADDGEGISSVDHVPQAYDARNA